MTGLLKLREPYSKILNPELLPSFYVERSLLDRSQRAGIGKLISEIVSFSSLTRKLYLRKNSETIIEVIGQ